MKTAMTISPPSGKLKFVSAMSSLDETIAYVAKNGFDAAELAIRDPKELDPAAIKKTLDENKIDLCVVGTGQSYAVDRLSLTSPDPENQKNAVERYKSQIRFAAYFGANIVIASSLGVVEEGVERAQAEEWAVKNLLELSAVAGDEGITILLEPINRYETNFINTIDQALAFNEKVENRLRILFDTFHMNIEAKSFTGELLKVKEKLGHVHIADSNRWAPGCGHINFQDIVHFLDEIGYDKYISAEVLPSPTVEKAIEITAGTFKAVLKK